MAKPTIRRKSTYVSRYRQRQRRVGLRRMEVVVGTKDAALVKSIAAVLRADGAEAAELRAKLRPDLIRPRTGADLLTTLRAGTLFDDQATFPRDKSTRPPISFE
jgi:hypothetical protein